MTYRYKNDNTGDEVEYPHPNARLEMLPNWNRIAAPAPEQAEEPKTPEAPSQPIERPTTRDGKDEWQAYARQQAKDSGEADEIATLTKAELIERYGKEA